MKKAKESGVETIKQLLNVAIKAVSSEEAFKSKLQFVNNNTHLRIVSNQNNNNNKGSSSSNENVTTVDIDMSRYKKLFVIGSGKASVAMANNLVKLLSAHLPPPTRLSGGIILTKFHHFDEESKSNLEKHSIIVREGSHPVPCEKGAAATLEMLDLIRQHDSVDTLFFYCLSGGSSALTGGVGRKPWLNIDVLKSIYEFLLRSGIPITEMNTIRKLLSSFQGGKAINTNSTFVTFLVSDVVGDALSTIGGAPTFVDDEPTLPLAQSIIANTLRHQNGFPSELHDAFFTQGKAVEENPLVRSEEKKATSIHCVISSNRDALNAMREYATARLATHKVIYLTSRLTGEAQQVAKVLAAIASERMRSHPAQAFVLLAGGECTVTIDSTCTGQGGRNLEMCLALAHEFKAENLPQAESLAFSSFATDGGDGTTDFAGAIVSGADLKAYPLGEMKQKLAEHDSLGFFLSKTSNNAMIEKMNTNTNVMDIIVILYNY